MRWKLRRRRDRGRTRSWWHRHRRRPRRRHWRRQILLLWLWLLVGLLVLLRRWYRGWVPLLCLDLSGILSILLLKPLLWRQGCRVLLLRRWGGSVLLLQR